MSDWKHSTRSALAASLLAALAACSSSTTPTGGAASDGGDGTDIGDGGGGGGTMCTSARNQLLAPLAKTSKGAVTVVSTSGATKVVYVDASAGGVNGSAPRVYVNLDTVTRVDLTDTAAFTSADWDLALKRTTLYTNSGDAGIGMGGAQQVGKAFASVTAADATKVVAETFFDDMCTAKTDPIGAPLSAFSDWYDYDMATNIPTPKTNVTYIVRGGTGKLFKVAITSYTGLADGGTGTATGFFLLNVAAL